MLRGDWWWWVGHGGTCPHAYSPHNAYNAHVNTSSPDSTMHNHINLQVKWRDTALFKLCKCKNTALSRLNRVSVGEGEYLSTECRIPKIRYKVACNECVTWTLEMHAKGVRAGCVFGCNLCRHAPLRRSRPKNGANEPCRLPPHSRAAAAGMGTEITASYWREIQTHFRQLTTTPNNGKKCYLIKENCSEQLLLVAMVTSSTTYKASAVL